MSKRTLSPRHVEEIFFMILMVGSFILLGTILILILWTIVAKGIPYLNLDMLLQTPKGGYYLGKEGGILNAIIGSLYLALGGTLIALVISLPIALYLQAYVRRSRWAAITRLTLDVLWGVPSIVYGAFGFIIMLTFGLRASLLGGILALAMLEMPIMTRAIDEVIRMLPHELEEASFAVGATRFDTAVRVALRQMQPGVITAVLLAFGRGIGDTASVLFTAGYTDRIPSSLFSPVASLPLAVFFQLGTPFPEVQGRAYAAALILTMIVLLISVGSRWLSGRISKFIVK